MRIQRFVSWAVGLVCLVVVSVNAQADPIVVNCDRGQSLHRTKAAHDTFTAQQAVYLVSQHAGIAIFAEPPSLTRHEGVVIKPLSDKSLSFETRLIMRTDQDSRAINEYARQFLRKYAPQLVAAKQMDLPLPA